MRRACQNKTRRLIQRLIEARPLKRQGFLSPKKSPHCCGDLLEAFASSPTKPTNHWRDDCADNEQSGQPIFISDNNANGGAKVRY
jgi:hypothetical protein